MLSTFFKWDITRGEKLFHDVTHWSQWNYSSMEYGSPSKVFDFVDLKYSTIR